MTLRATAESAEVAELYRLHFDYIWQVLQKLGVDASSLEDAAHDVFMVAHRRWVDFEGRSSPRTWLFSVARRVADRHRRSAFRRRRCRSALALVPSVEPPGPDAQVLRRQAWQLLLDFLDGLEPAQRDAFVLGELEGMSRSRMGVILGISPNTAYSRLRAARSRFSEVFPVPARRAEVREASLPPSREAKRRGWVLFVAHIGAKSTVLGALVPAASIVAMAVAGVLWRPSAQPADIGAPHSSVPVAMGAVDRPSRTESPRPVTALASAEAEGARARALTGRPAPRSWPRPRGNEASGVDRLVTGLGPSMESLARARRALQHGNPLRAVNLLEESQQQDPDGAFSIERAVTRVLALCAASRVRQAHEALSPLRSSGGLSAYVRVLGDSCVAEQISSGLRGDQGS